VLPSPQRHRRRRNQSRHHVSPTPPSSPTSSPPLPIEAIRGWTQRRVSPKPQALYGCNRLPHSGW
jgi:hypothetical protein